jgi:ferritin-like metal-binding protein YciE
MQKAATTEELKDAIEDHLAQTEEQIVRIEQAFEMMGKKAQAKKCEAMEGLIKEGESVIEDTEDGSMTRDAGIIIGRTKSRTLRDCNLRRSGSTSQYHGIVVK